MSFGVGEILLVLAIVVFFFGAKRIPVIAKGLGEGIRNFKSSVKEGEGEDERLETGDREEEKRLSGDGSS
jgi:sec-independent protein translocase protein TatA